jgi:hypothetical protein
MVDQGKGFHSFPDKYPKARRKASDVVSHMVELTKKGPRTMVAIVADASFHTTQGYVTCTTELGIVSVYGVPFGSVVPGMRIFCRQMGGQSAIRGFVFDGMAANLSGAGFSGSFGYSSIVSSLSTGLAMTSSTGVPSTSALNFVYAYFWFWFFYIPALPTSPVTLWQMISNADATTLSAEYLPNGQLRVIDGIGHGYISNGPISPHNIHWIIIQPGLASQSISIDNVPALYTGIVGSGDNPNFSAGGAAYRLCLLSRSDGSQLAPLGSWISKFCFGSCWNGSGQVALQSLGTGVGAVPSIDAELPSAIAQADIFPLYQLLCLDAAGSSTLADSAGMGGLSASIASGGAVLAQGPY